MVSAAPVLDCVTRIVSPLTCCQPIRITSPRRWPAHRVRGVELLGDGNERDLARLEPLDETREVGERPSKPVDLIDNDYIDAAVIETIPERDPARTLLA
jgi:hypothetical protein